MFYLLLNEFITGQIPGMRYFPLVDHFIMAAIFFFIAPEVAEPGSATSGAIKKNLPP